MEAADLAGVERVAVVDRDEDGVTDRPTWQTPPAVGSVPSARSVVDVARNAGADAWVVDDVRALAEGGTTVAVALGEAALTAVARSVSDVPTLPVAAGRGVRSVPGPDVERALRAVIEGEARTTPLPRFDVTVGGASPVPTVLDVVLVTSDPARISEYGVQSGDRHVSQFRADGVVLATPAGTHGYAASVDAPHLDPDAGVVAVTPVAPFVTDADRWVLADDRVTLSVERDDGPVSVYADGRELATVGIERAVCIERSGSLPVVLTGSSLAVFPDGSER